MVKNLPAIQETWVLSLGQEDPLEEGMATHSSIFAWRIYWTEEPGRLQFMGSERVGHDWSTNTSLQVNEKLHSDLIYFGYNTMYFGFLCVNLLLSLQIWYKLLWIVDWCEPQNRVSTSHTSKGRRKPLWKPHQKLPWYSWLSFIFQYPGKQRLGITIKSALGNSCKLFVIKAHTFTLIFQKFRNDFCSCSCWTLSSQGEAEVFRRFCQPSSRLRPQLFYQPTLTSAF